MIYLHCYNFNFCFRLFIFQINFDYNNFFFLVFCICRPVLTIWTVIIVGGSWDGFGSTFFLFLYLLFMYCYNFFNLIYSSLSSNAFGFPLSLFHCAHFYLFLPISSLTVIISPIWLLLSFFEFLAFGSCFAFLTVIISPISCLFPSVDLLPDGFCNRRTVIIAPFHP